MRKYIKIFGVVIFVYCCLGIFNVLQPQHNIATPDGPLYETPGMIKKPVPVYCGPTEFMLDSAVKGFKQQPYIVGSVIVPTTQETVAILSIFVHTDKVTDMSVLMTMLNTNETCVLAYGHNLKFYNQESSEPSLFQSGDYKGMPIAF